MDRKRFIQTSSIGLGMALIPNVLKSDNSATRLILKSTPEAKIVRNEEGNILNVLGDIQTHKLGGADTADQIVEWVNEVSPGVGIPPHVHTKEDEIFRVIKGEIEITIGGETTVLKQGDVAFAPKDIAHAWKVVGTETASMCTSAFPAGIEHLFAELGKLPAGPPDFPKVAEMCGKYGISFV